MNRAKEALLALTVALVLADSAIVTLALPEIAYRFDASVTQAAWVLMSYNIVLALVAVPCAWWGLRGGDQRIGAAVGIAVFAAASAWCAVAPSIDVLIAARCLQALGGALALVGCLSLLSALRDDAKGFSIWVAAGVAGTAVGPAAGGVLTDLLSWQAIFVAQVPCAALAVAAALAVRTARVDAPGHPPRTRLAVRENVALALLSAGLTAALFLVVLLLVEGWQHSPTVAALVVSVIALAALIAPQVARRLGVPTSSGLVAGTIAMAGGLAGLALLPSSDVGWTIAPLALVGAGLGLTVEQLSALAAGPAKAGDGGDRGVRAAWTVTARHVGVVLGLALLTPIFSADLRDAQQPAREAITARVLDAPITPAEKVRLAGALAAQVQADRGKVPDLAPAFDQVTVSAASQPAFEQLERDLNAEFKSAATAAFRTAFGAAAALTLLALAALLGTGWSLRGLLAPAGMLLAVLGLLTAYALQGGGSVRPTASADPCVERPVSPTPDDVETLGQALVVLSLDEAACRLGVSREDLTLQLGQQASASPTQIAALRAGTLRAIDRLESAGQIPPAAVLADQIVPASDLPRWAKRAISLLPDAVINRAIATDDVLRRTVDQLDFAEIVSSLDDGSALNDQLEQAITQSVIETVKGSARDLLP